GTVPAARWGSSLVASGIPEYTPLYESGPCRTPRSPQGRAPMREEAMAATGPTPMSRRTFGAGAACALLTAAGAGSVRAQSTAAVDPRSGSVRIYVSLATSAMTRLVAALNRHFPNLKIDFVRAGSIETVKRFVAERQAGRIATDLIHGADPGGFEYFAQKGWLDTR